MNVNENELRFDVFLIIIKKMFVMSLIYIRHRDKKSSLFPWPFICTPSRREELQKNFRSMIL